MRKKVFGRRLKRDANERKALFKSLMRALVLEERIKTTEAKAKAIKGQVEKMITYAKKNGENSRNYLQKYFPQDVYEKIISDISLRYINRPGGYTRIIKLGNRLKDNAKIVMLEWIEGENIEKTEKEEVVLEKPETSKKKKQTSIKQVKKEIKKDKNEKINKTNKNK